MQAIEKKKTEGLWANARSKLRTSLLWTNFARISALLLLLPVLSCDVSRSETVGEKHIEQVFQKDDGVAMEHYIQALSAHRLGDHSVCAASFARSANSSESTELAAERWYEAARCAARAGEFHDSQAFLQSAVSVGYSDLNGLMTEPLFRPLYDGGRWDIIVDQIASHPRSQPAQAATSQALDEGVVVVARELLSILCDEM